MSDYWDDWDGVNEYNDKLSEISKAVKAEKQRNAAEIERLQADNARLKGALQEIAAIENVMEGPDWEEIDRARDIARTALGGKEMSKPTPTNDLISPWVPMQEAIDKKHIGKLLEELGEAVSAASRCLIQGIDETEPVTGKPNREWLEDELADVTANINLVVQHFKLDVKRMETRCFRKIAGLRRWHAMLNREKETT